MSEHQVDHDLYRGALGIAVLSLLAQSEDHGYGLAKRLEQNSKGALSVSQGAVYPLLHRLERQGFVESSWVRTSNGRKAKLYSITTKGRTWLQSRTSQWERLSDALGKIIESSRLSPEGS